MTEKKATRRGFLGVVATAVVVGVVAGVGGYYAGLSTIPPEITTTVTTTQTRTVGTGEMVTTTITPPPVTTTITPPPVTTTRTITQTPTTTTPPTGEEIRIGAPLSLTGYAGIFGQGSMFGHQMAAEAINKRGGVDVGGRKMPIKYIAYDDGSDPAKAASVASQLILADKVDAMVEGSLPPPTANPVSVQADRYKVPTIVASPFEAWWAAGPFEYAWSHLFRIGAPIPEGDPRAGKLGFTAVDQNLTFTGRFRDQTNERIALLAADDADGRGWYGAFSQILPNEGYKPWGVDRNLGLYPPGTTDFSSMIREWRDNNCEIMWGNLPGPDMGVVLRQSAELGYRPKICIPARAGLYYEDVASWGGDLAWGVAVQITWYPSYPYEGIDGETGPSINKKWFDATGLQPNMSMGFSYGEMQVIADAIERAGTLDKEEVNKAIGETDLVSLNGRIKYIPETHDSPSPLTFGQWIKTDKPWVWELVTVHSDHPEIKATHEPLFPMPPLK